LINISQIIHTHTYQKILAECEFAVVIVLS
jgi:hypothetical protein